MGKVVGNLGITYEAQGHYDEAERMLAVAFFEDVLETVPEPLAAEVRQWLSTKLTAGRVAKHSPLPVAAD